MIDELEIERYLKSNFNVTFVDTTIFTGPGNKVYHVSSYIIEGIETLKNLNKDGLSKIYVYKDEMSHILFKSLNFTPFVIRWYPIYSNKRYKLNKKNE